MTTIVAVAAKDKVFLVADKRITPADVYKLDNAVTKIVVHQPEGYAPTYIGIAGTLSAMQAFELFLETEEADFTDVKSIYRLFLNFRNDLHTNQLCLTNNATDSDFAVLPLQALIVNNEGKLFTVFNYGEVIEHTEYTAIGSGMSFALGALHATLNNNTDPYNAMLLAMSAASTFDAATGDQYDTYEIPLEESTGE